MPLSSTAGIYDLAFESDSEFEILLTPKEFTHYDPLQHKSVIKKDGVSGRNKIIKKGKEFSFYSKAASQNEFSLRSSDLIIKDESFTYKHFGETVTLTFLVENQMESGTVISVHIIHLFT
jgi:hypothetical protein